MEENCYREELKNLLIKNFITYDDNTTTSIEFDSVSENSKYAALTFSLNGKNVVYRKAKITSDRPGAFLAIWQRPPSIANTNKPIPLRENDLDYLFVEVDDKTSPKLDRHGIFIFPVSLLVARGIIYSDVDLIKRTGKTGFRVFPPWSQDRGLSGTKIFSESGKKTQLWQLPYFLGINKEGMIDPKTLSTLLNQHNSL